MNKKKELAKNTLIITVGKISTQFISFLLLPLYTALLSTEQYGAVDLVTTYVQLLLPLIIFQIDQAAFRHLIDNRKNKKDSSKIISSAFAFILLQFIFFTIIFIVSLLWFENQYKWLLYANVLAAALSSLFLQVARGFGDNGTYAIASFLAAFTTVVLNVIFIVLLNMKAEGMMLATFIANIVCSLYVFYKDSVYRYISFRKISERKIKDMLSYSFPLVPNALSWWIVNASDRSIVLAFLGASANGILAASHKFSTMFMSFYNIFNMSWTESAALHLHEDDKDDFFSNIVDTVFRLFMAGCIVIIAFMPFIFPIMINVNFSEAYFQVPIYMLAAMFNVIAGLYSVVYIANKKTKEIAKTSIIAGVINIVINFALIKYIGLYAASISSLISYAAMAIYRYFDVKKYVRQKVNWKVIISSIAILSTILIIYYFKIYILEIVGLIISIIYSLLINRAFLKGVIETIKKILQKSLL